MLAATQHRLVGGDFVFIYIDSELATSEFYTLVKQASFWMKGDGSDVDMRKAYENLLMLSVKTETQEELKEFYRRADEAAAQSDWQRQFGVTATKSDVTSPFLHDAVLLYAKLAMEVFASGKNYNNGSVLVEHVKNKHYENKDGATGQMTLDENGDRDPFFWVFDLHQDGSFQVVAEVIHQYNNGQQQRVVKFVQDIIWGDKKVGFSNKPADVLICGFQGEKCPDYTVYVVTPTVSATVLIILVVSLFVYRKYRFEQSLHDMAWQIQYSDLKPKGQGHRDYTSSLKLQSAGSSRTSGRIRSLSGMVTRRSGHMTSCTSSLSRGSLDDHGQIFASTAVYRGMTVAVKTLRKASVRMSKKLLLEMKLMTVDLKNQNLAVFLGVTVETPNICEVWEYCPKGSLQDVIWNENIKLDDMFKFSMAIDIFKGLKYLHESELGCHGRLKSPNCVIDGRWVCKLTDYGLDHFRGGQYLDPEVTDHMKYSSQFWMAPELLRTLDGKTQSQKGDIYAGAVILKEIFSRSSPYSESDEVSPPEIIEKVRDGPGLDMGPFRPVLSELAGSETLRCLIRQSWTEDPADRPSVTQLLKDLQFINPFKTANVLDNMVSMMEKYTNNLEELVSERTSQLEEEKTRSEDLLLRMLPRSVAECLKHGVVVQPEAFNAVSIYFSDIVQFTKLSAASTAIQVVTMLNELYTIFDEIIASHDVYKVETIGDAYMLVSGVPQANADSHAAHIANCALQFLSAVLQFTVPHLPDYTLRIRTGVHSGPVVAGIVGLTMPRYCLFGDTVLVAALLESNGLPMRIHISETTYTYLADCAGFRLAYRDKVALKGKAAMKTYWLVGRDDYDKPLPDFRELSAEDHPPPKLLGVTGKTSYSPTLMNIPNTPDNRKTSVNDIAMKIDEMPST